MYRFQSQNVIMNYALCLRQTILRASVDHPEQTFFVNLK